MDMGGGDRLDRLNRLVLVSLLALWVWSWWQMVSLPENTLVANVLVDDALYFALPAQNWWQGRGFSFDGLEATNGVQTLWALVSLAVAGICSEPLAMLRSLVGLSALCWLGAACGVLGLLRPYSRHAAAFAATGFAFAGVSGRIAFQGMENGLHALLTVAVLWAGRHAVRARWSRRATLWLGLVLALFGLSRTEGVLLGPIVALPILVGLLGAPSRFAERCRTALWLALPGVLLVGGACLLSKWWFDCFLPISGSVKQHYEAMWGGASDPAFAAANRCGVFAMTRWHFDFVFRLAMAPFRVSLPAFLDGMTGIGYRLFRNAFWALLACVVASFVWRGWRGRRGREGYEGYEDNSGRVTAASFAWCVVGYAVVHVVLIGLSLPHFSSYATWYFASEMVVVWLGIGVLASRLRGGAAWLLHVAALLAAVALAVDGARVNHDVRTSRFRQAGRWLRQNTPPGTVIGALSSGLVGWYARDQHVVNLDGLINNRRYFDRFLKTNAVHDYFADRGITWFSDYSVTTGWRNGVTWCGHVPAERLVPRRYWRISPTDAYATWLVLPEGATFEMLGDEGPAVRDRYAELAVAADVYGTYPVIENDRLESELVAQPGMSVARSLVAGVDEVWHVLATAADHDRIALTETTVQPQHRERLQLSAGLHAMGCDVEEFAKGGRRVVAVTVYWLRDAAAVEDARPTLVRPNLARPTVALAVEGQLEQVQLQQMVGMRPMAEWLPGRVVPETVLFEVPGGASYRIGAARDLPSGERIHAWFTR
ncbi:MAG: hypothetical protein AB8H80_04350 [Planctomycetota bacterium]